MPRTRLRRPPLMRCPTRPIRPSFLNVEMQQAANHLRTVRSLTPTPGATAAGGSCWVRTRATIWPRLRGVVGLLVCGDGRLATTTVAELAWINNLLAVQS